MQNANRRIEDDMKKEIILVGYFCEAIELCEKSGYTISGIIDNENPDDKNYPYLGDDNYILEHSILFKHIPLFMVPDSPKLRQHLYELYHEKGFRFETIISPKAIVSRNVKIDEGCMVQDGCNISSGVRLGKLVRVNSLANIMHDSIVEDYSTIAPSAVVLGRCNVKSIAYVGANATILPNRIIGIGGVVGAGAVVTKNVVDGVTVAGVPARPLNL